MGEREKNGPPPTMQTSTSSLSRSMVLGSNESSGAAMHLDSVVENGLVVAVVGARRRICGILLLAGWLCIIEGRQGVRNDRAEIELAGRASRPDILMGADMIDRQDSTEGESKQAPVTGAGFEVGGGAARRKSGCFLLSFFFPFLRLDEKRLCTF